MVKPTRLGYCQYLLGSPMNYQVHSRKTSHRAKNELRNEGIVSLRIMARSQIILTLLAVD